MELVDGFFKKYEDAGFHFPSSLLTTYALSLVSKPFVILSGISGTGKTKIAQLFEVPKINNTGDTAMQITVPSLSIKVPKVYGRFNFEVSLLSNILTSAELQDFYKRADEFKQNNDGGNFSKTYVLEISDEYGSFKIGIYGQRAASPLIRARFYRSNRDTQSPSYDARAHLDKYYKVNDILELEKVADKKYKVKSVNNIEVATAHKRHELNSLEQNCFISVRSGWTDNNELLGYYNLIEQKYHIPQFLEFVLNSINYPQYPFFVILDEMNLSQVEHYFSDILSCTESRIQTKEGLKQEKIILRSGTDVLKTDSDFFDEIPSSIEIPSNLFITGTVNIDESTFSFSSKVLDRANIIEFNEVNLINYDDDKYIDNESFKLRTFPDFSNIELPSKKHYNKLPPVVKSHLIAINNILTKHHLHFGYRVANEIGLYVANAQKYIKYDDNTSLKALDHQLIQKVFAKLNGDYATLEEPIKEIVIHLSGQKDISKVLPEETNFPLSVSKLKRMYSMLSKRGYARFVE